MLTIRTRGIQLGKRGISGNRSGPDLELSFEMTDSDPQMGRRTRYPDSIGSVSLLAVS